MFSFRDSTVCSQSLVDITNVFEFVTTLNEAVPFALCFLMNLINAIHFFISPPPLANLAHKLYSHNRNLNSTILLNL
jgi:hypothetical protein